jgi:hypothetical protein
MNKIKKYDILCCVNEKDSHFLKFCKVDSIEYDDSYPTVIKSVEVRYENETVIYKAMDMEYNFIIVKRQTLIFD